MPEAKPLVPDQVLIEVGVQSMTVTLPKIPPDVKAKVQQARADWEKRRLAHKRERQARRQARR